MNAENALEKSSKALRRPGSKPYVIVVLGAKAETSFTDWSRVKPELLHLIANEKLLSRKELVDELWTEFGYLLGPRPDGDYNRALKRDTVTVEMLCNILTKLNTYKKKVQDILTKLYGKPEGVSLCYELVAHALKHKIFDMVISLNWDPLLDHSLEAELDPSEYALLFSDFQALDLSSEQTRLSPLAKPVVFKLHGTTTYPETMKFSFSETGGMSLEVRNAIQKVLNYQRGRRKILLYSYGYAWNDVDMVHWLQSQLRELQHAYICLRKRTKTELLDSFESKMVEEERCELEAKFSVIASSEFGEEPTAGEILWSQLTINREINTVPLERHILKSKFREHGSRFTFYSETQIEILLHIVKSKGMAVTTNLANDPRITTYFNKLSQRSKEKLFKWMLEICTTDSNELRDVYYETNEEKWLQFLESRFSKRSWNRPTTVALDEPPYFDKKPFSCYVFDALKHIRMEGTDTEVRHPSGESVAWMFDKPNYISTFAELVATTTKHSRQSHSHILAIAETGNWLTQHLASNGLATGNIGLITANPPSKWKFGEKEAKRIKGALGEQLTAVTMPWWRHNQHMTLWVDESASLFRGIYFRRQNRSNVICPVSVEGEDCLELLLLFMTYLRRIGEQWKTETLAFNSLRDTVNQVRKVARKMNVSSNRRQTRLRRINREWSNLSKVTPNKTHRNHHSL